jgi:hypothetical protein
MSMEEHTPSIDEERDNGEQRLVGRSLSVDY